MVDRSAWAAMLKAKSAFDPHFTFHLGDFCDTACFRTGATNAEKREGYRGDISTGLTHLDQLQPQLVLCGNHEARFYKAAQDGDGRIAELAGELVNHVERFVGDQLKAELVPYNGVLQGRMLGNYLLTHGTIYNVNAARDMAETYGNVIFGHTHTCADAMGRRVDQPRGINIGTLTDRRCMEYAHLRRQTIAWRQGWIYGEYCDTDLQPFLHIHQNEGHKIEFPHAQAA